MIRLFVEAVVVGISVALAGVVVTLLGKNKQKKLPAECRNWNENYIMEITLFLIGFMLHLFFEFTGVNSWYCKHGNAVTKSK